MNEQTPTPDATLPHGNAALETVLAAWHDATVRLEQTHGALREEVRRLTDELEIKNRELARKNRLADLGQMASHIAHEVRNNLVPVTLYLSLLRRRLLGDQRSGEQDGGDQDGGNQDGGDQGSLKVMDKIAAGLTAMDATVNDLLHFTSDREPRLQTFSLRKLVNEVCASLTPQLSAQSIETAIDVADDRYLTADQDMLRRAVLNLVLNAVDAMPGGGELEITSSAVSSGIELEIADSGPGLSDEVKARAFEPFFTTKQGGTGLGLAIVCRIAEAHGGQLTAANCSQGGAAFTIRIPQTDMQEAAA